MLCVGYSIYRPILSDGHSPAPSGAPPLASEYPFTQNNAPAHTSPPQ